MPRAKTGAALAALAATVGGNPDVIAANAPTLTIPRLGETRGDFLKRMRQEKGLSHGALAKATHQVFTGRIISQAQVQRAEQNPEAFETDIELWQTLALALDLPEGRLLRAPLAVVAQASSANTPDGSRLITDDPAIVGPLSQIMHAAMEMSLAPRPDETRGAFLKRMRQERGMTLEELADATDQSAHTLGMAEKYPEQFPSPHSDGFWQLAADALSLPEDIFLSVPASLPVVIVPAQPAAALAELRKALAPTPAATVTAPATIAPPAPAGIALLRHADLYPSPFNSRKNFDADELELLAGTIATQGLLQNLVARRRPDGRGEIVAGERRWRAIGLLIDRGQWDADAANIPTLLRDMTDTEHRAAMIVENLSRKDPTPLEEARGFAELQEMDPDLYTTDHIAQTIGVTPRMVQQRLKLLTALAPEALAALEDGTISVSMARALYQSPSTAMQRTIIAAIRAGDARLQSVNGIKDYVTRGMIPVSRAKFPIQMYMDATEGHDGDEIVEFENGARYMPHRDTFMGLQEWWCQERCRALMQEGWDWAHVEPTLAHWKYTHTDVKQKGAGCVLVLSPTDGSVTEHRGLLPVPAKAPAGGGTRVTLPVTLPDTAMVSPPAAAFSLPLSPPPPPAAAAPAAPPAKPDPLLSHAQQHAHRSDMEFFRGRLMTALIENPTDMMILMILDRGRPHTDSLFERVHSSDCVLPASLFHDDDGDPGPLFPAIAQVQVDDEEIPPSDNTCVFSSRDAMGGALLELIAEGDPGSIAETWAGLMADTIFLDSGTLHPVWREYATLRAIPLPDHFRMQGAGQ
ncbi:ParB/RepB/Spo0J family partition protein [Niveispirillum fermenti]|uniref:ParB/RepB/Spo0J family partition protein n=1 Tax=Niveispirillum fermenti TaxID=1233113 RepID=UPI003A888BB6